MTDDLSRLSEYHTILLIEWDGRNPGGTWYDYLHRHNIWTRKGSKEEYPSALARRYHAAMSKNPIAISHNEGVYLCQSIDVANRIAAEAHRLGAQSVVVGTTYIRNLNIPEADKQAFDAMRRVESKRGRRSEDERGIYTVTCYAEAVSVETESDMMPQVCSQCGGHRIHSYMGKQPAYVLSPDDQTDVFDLWMRSRFDGDGKFLVPRFVKKGGTTLPTAPRAHVSLPNISLPPDVPQDTNMQLRIMDAVYCLSALLGEDYRKIQRLDKAMAWMNYCMSEGREDFDKWNSARPVDHYDLLDVTIVAGELEKYL